MEKLVPAKRHLEKLAEYGLQGMPPESVLCLRFGAGEVILREGQPIPWLALVVSGTAKVCATAPNGKNLVLCYYVSGGMVGDIELMAGAGLATATLVAVTGFECVALPRAACAGPLKTNAVFLNRLGAELAQKLIRSSDNFVAAALYSGEERLCWYILQAERGGLFRDVLADVSCSTGMSYRHLFRLLGGLCGAGVLQKCGGGYRILDREALVRRAEGCRSPKTPECPPPLP